MTPFERNQVENIIRAYWIHEDGIWKDIPWMGSSIAGQLVDFKGDLPPPSNYKVESVSSKAEQLRWHEIGRFAMYAALLFKKLDKDHTKVLLAPLRYQTRHNKTPTDGKVADSIGMEYETYRNHKRVYKNHVLVLDKQIREELYIKPAQHVVAK